LGIIGILSYGYNIPYPFLRRKYVRVKFSNVLLESYCLGGLVLRVPGYRFRGPGSIPGDTRLSEI
jgi:hypothetical protein